MDLKQKGFRKRNISIELDLRVQLDNKSIRDLLVEDPFQKDSMLQLCLENQNKKQMIQVILINGLLLK
jgi:hypothetical protein